VSSADEYYVQVYKSFEGKVIRIPGLPPMYDYDMFPQEVCEFVRVHEQVVIDSNRTTSTFQLR
jgi:hypothetical protein